MKRGYFERRVVDVGLSCKPLSVDELEALLEGVEERVRGVLRRILGRRLTGFEITVEGRLYGDGKGLTVSVEVFAEGRQIAPISYEELVAEAIDEAARWLYERLRQRGGEGCSREAH
ncbi:MAG: hypothetical protein DSY37_04395 [Hyperthermus sp.]|nr:MAG: hypothetical protein DSY37_04395 [Hyperthermus sp.]